MDVQKLLSSVEVIDADVFRYGYNELCGETSCVPAASLCSDTCASPEDEQEVELDEVISKQDIVKVDREPSLLLYVKPDRTKKATPRKFSRALGAPAGVSLMPKLQDDATDTTKNSEDPPSRSITNSLRCIKKLKPINKNVEDVNMYSDNVIDEVILNATKDKVEKNESQVVNGRENCGEHNCDESGSVQDCTEIASACDDERTSCSSDCETDCDDIKQENQASCGNSGEDETESVQLKKKQEHEKEVRDHVCEICAAAFTQRSHLATHMRRHDTERRFKCNECGSCFKTKSSVYFHMKCHAEAPFVCTICSKEYPERKKLMRHVRLIHASVDRYPCNKCGKAFKTRQKYNLHYTLHSGQKPFTCDLCQKTFVYKSTFVQHMYSHQLHKAFKCDLCPKEYALCADFRKHYQNHLESRPFKCPSCAKSFALKGTLKNHMKTHEPEKPFKCQLCEKSFMKKESYDCHMMVHNGEKPKYLCDQCSTSYYNIFALKRHYMKHTGERKFSCMVCSRAFWMKDALNVHMRVHSSAKPFPCTQCPKAFSHKHTLESHLKAHQNIFPNVCPFCQKSFTHRANFCRHVQLHEHSSS